MLKGKGRLYKKFEGYFFVSFFSQLKRAYSAKSNGKADASGNSWSPLSPSTIRKKQRKGRSSSSAKKINVDTRAGIRSFNPGSAEKTGYSPGDENQLFDKADTSYLVGSKLPYLNYAFALRSLYNDEMLDRIINEAIKIALGKLTKDLKRALK